MQDEMKMDDTFLNLLKVVYELSFNRRKMFSKSQ